MAKPPSKQELDRINKELQELRKPKPPAPKLRPGGAMRPSADRVDKEVQEAMMREREERAEYIKERLSKAKETMEKGREKFRNR